MDLFGGFVDLFGESGGQGPLESQAGLRSVFGASLAVDDIPEVVLSEL